MNMHFREYMKFTGVSAFFAFSIFLFNPILSPYIKGLGFGDFQISILFSILPLSVIVFSPIVGKLSDVAGRRVVIVMGIALEILAVLLYVFGRSFVLIGIARVFDAIAVVTVILVSLAKVEDVIGSKKRGEYTGWAESLNYVGRLVAPVIGAVIADMFFIEAPFFISIVLLLALFFFLFKREKIPKMARKNYNPLTEIKEFLSFRKLKGMGILGIVMHASTPAISLFLPLFIIYELGLGISFVGYAFFFMGFMHLFQFWFGRISDKYGSWKIVLLGCLISAISLGMMSLSNSFVFLALVLFIYGIGGGMWNTSAWSLMSDIGEKNRKEGEIATSYVSIAKIGAFFSFILSGLVVTYFSIQTLFLINGLVILAGMALSYSFLKK